MSDTMTELLEQLQTEITRLRNVEKEFKKHQRVQQAIDDLTPIIGAPTRRAPMSTGRWIDTTKAVVLCRVPSTITDLPDHCSECPLEPDCIFLMQDCPLVKGVILE